MALLSVPTLAAEVAATGVKKVLAAEVAKVVAEAVGLAAGLAVESFWDR